MANIFFKTVTLKNFISYEYAELQLDQNGFIVVKGVNSNPEDSAKSNGSGKSSLFSAITWCLTGETISGAKNVENIYLKGTTEVTTEFELDGINYKITRTKNPSNLFLSVNGEDKSGKGIRDTEKIVSEYLPQLTYKLITSVIVLGQGLPQRFSNNTPSGRKEVLEQLSNSDFMIADIKERLRIRKADLSAQQEDCKIKKAGCLTTQDITKNNLDALKEKLIAMDASATQHLLNEARIKVNELQEDADSLEGMLEDITVDKEAAIQAYDDFILSLDAQKRALPLKILDEETENVYQLKAKAAALETDLQNKRNIKDTCPTCGQKIPGVFKPDTAQLEAEVAQAKEAVTAAEEILQGSKAANQLLIKDFEIQFNNQKQDLKDQRDTLVDDYNNLFNKLTNVKNDLVQQQATIQVLEQTLNNFKQKQSCIEAEIADNEAKLRQLDYKIVYINNELDTLDKRIEIHNQMDNLIKRDFRGYLLTNVIEYISNRTKVYCKEIFNTTNISFTLEGNNILIAYDGKEYEVLSGGEKQKIDIIVQLALRDMLCKYLNFSSNILVLDEITDALDATGARKVFDLISNKLNDVKAIYIISHHIDDFDIPQDAEILVEKGSDKISRII